MNRRRLNLEQLDTLLALIEGASFNETGSRLGLAQSTVSQHIKRLEKALGAVLIRRDRRGCRPTAAALRLLPYAKSLLSLEERVVDASHSRRPRLGACSNIGTYLLPDLLRSLQDHSGATPHVVIGSNPEIVFRLERAEVDAALLEWWGERDGFRWQPWRNEHLVVIVPPDHPFGRRGSISRAELAHQPLIGGEPGTGTGRLLRAAYSDEPMPEVVMQLGSTEAVKRAVEAGLGVSLVLACSVANEIREGRLCALLLEDRVLEKSLRLVWRDDLTAKDPLLSFLSDAASKKAAAGLSA